MAAKDPKMSKKVPPARGSM